MISSGKNCLINPWVKILLFGLCNLLWDIIFPFETHQRQLVYLAVSSKITSGAILPLDKLHWLNWSCEKDDMHGLAYCLCHVT